MPYVRILETRSFVHFSPSKCSRTIAAIFIYVSRYVQVRTYLLTYLLTIRELK